MINKSCKKVNMKVVIERTDDNKSWLIMIQDMLGKRPYIPIEFETSGGALNYIIEEFKNCSDYDIEIN